MIFSEKQKQSEYLCYLLLIICAAFALSYPLAFRTAASEQLFVGGESYEVLLAAQNSAALLHPSQNDLQITTTSPRPTPFFFPNYVYSILLTVIPPWALPALISLLLLTLLWVTLNSFSLSLSARFIAACIFAFSPLFVSTQLSLGSASFLFMSLSLLILALRSHWHPLICVWFAFLAGLFGIDAIVPIIFILLLCVQKSGQAPIDKEKRYSAVGALLGLSVWLYLSIITKTSFSTLFSAKIIAGLLIDFGAQTGQTLLLLVLAVIGAINVWNIRLRWHFVASLVIVLWSSFFPSVALVATSVLSYFAGSAFTKIWNSKWTHQSLKIIVLASILLAVLTSYFIFSNQLIHANPDVSATRAYEFISKNTPADAVIFASPTESPMISYFAQRHVVNTNNPRNALFSEMRLQTQKVVYAKTLQQVVSDLKSLNVTHILIDPQSLSGDHWREDKGGLPLLLRNKRTFTLVYDANYLLYQINYGP